MTTETSMAMVPQTPSQPPSRLPETPLPSPIGNPAENNNLPEKQPPQDTRPHINQLYKDAPLHAKLLFGKDSFEDRQISEADINQLRADPDSVIDNMNYLPAMELLEKNSQGSNLHKDMESLLKKKIKEKKPEKQPKPPPTPEEKKQGYEQKIGQSLKKMYEKSVHEAFVYLAEGKYKDTPGKVFSKLDWFKEPVEEKPKPQKAKKNKEAIKEAKKILHAFAINKKGYDDFIQKYKIKPGQSENDQEKLAKQEKIKGFVNTSVDMFTDENTQTVDVNKLMLNMGVIGDMADLAFGKGAAPVIAKYVEAVACAKSVNQDTENFKGSIYLEEAQKDLDSYNESQQDNNDPEKPNEIYLQTNQKRFLDELTGKEQRPKILKKEEDFNKWFDEQEKKKKEEQKQANEQQEEQSQAQQGQPASEPNADTEKTEAEKKESEEEQISKNIELYNKIKEIFMEEKKTPKEDFIEKFEFDPDDETQFNLLIDEFYKKERLTQIIEDKFRNQDTRAFLFFVQKFEQARQDNINEETFKEDLLKSPIFASLDETQRSVIIQRYFLLWGGVNKEVDIIHERKQSEKETNTTVFVDAEGNATFEKPEQKEEKGFVSGIGGVEEDKGFVSGIGGVEEDSNVDKIEKKKEEEYLDRPRD